MKTRLPRKLKKDVKRWLDAGVRATPRLRRWARRASATLRGWKWMDAD